MKKFKFLFLIILVVTFFTSAPNVNAVLVEGWAKNVDLYTDVNLKPCNATKCDGTHTLTDEYIYSSDDASSVAYSYLSSNTHSLGTNGDMILSYHRYKAGYLYSHTSYVCFTGAVAFNGFNIYVGGYNDTLNKVGNLTYSSGLQQTLSNNPFSPGDEYYSCYAFTSLFSPSVDGQNIGKVLPATPATASVQTRVILIGEKYEQIGIYTSSLNSTINNAIANSGLATADSVEEVNNSINQVKQELNGVNDNLTNDNVDSSTGSDFFDSFTTTDNGGISAIVTSPLIAIEKMTSGVCTPLSATYKGKELSLPCGNSFWADMPDVRQFLNVCLGGFLCYGILAKLYLLIDRLKNPDDDRVDVMKL